MMNAATRSILQFSLIGIALAGGFLGILQARPVTVLPFEGTLSVRITNPRLPPALGGVIGACIAYDCKAASLNLTIDSVLVHRVGESGLTGGWLQISNGTTT